MQHKPGGYIAFLILACTCLLACRKLPDGVLSESKMQRVLEDMLIAESLLGTQYQDFRNDSAKQRLYFSVFQKHNVTQAQYDSSLVWYGKDLDAYMRMHDTILVNLSRRITDLGDIQASVNPSLKQDSVDIWPRRNLLVLQPNAVFNGVIFDVTPEQSFSSGSSFVLGTRVWGLKSDMKYKPEISISAVHRDTTITITKEIKEDGYFETVLRTLPTRQIQKVYGYIRMDNSGNDYLKVYIDSLSLHRYNYGTAIPGNPQ